MGDPWGVGDAEAPVSLPDPTCRRHDLSIVGGCAGCRRDARVTDIVLWSILPAIGLAAVILWWTR
jgi:hypothetical protein